MQVLKKTARCPRCGRPLLTSGRLGDDVRVMYSYFHVNRKIKRHIEVIWKHEQKFYEVGVYGKLFKETVKEIK